MWQIDFKPIKGMDHNFMGGLIPWWLMTTYHSEGFSVTHVSGNFCCRQSACQVVAPTSSTSGGVRYFTSNSCYCGLNTHFPISQSEVWAALLSLGKHCTWNISSAVCLTTASRKQVLDTPRFKTDFFHANLCRECLVSFLSWEIWTTACSRL